MTGRQSAVRRAGVTELEKPAGTVIKRLMDRQPLLPPWGNTKSLFIVVCTDVSELSISLIILEVGTSILTKKTSPLAFTEFFF